MSALTPDVEQIKKLQSRPSDDPVAATMHYKRPASKGPLQMKIRLCLTILTLFVVVGCSTLKPVELTPEQLQDKILTENIVREGDRVQVVTFDGTRHSFRVKAVTRDYIEGKDIKIPISEVVALETREFSGGKTSLLVGGTLMLYWVYILVAISMMSF